MDDMFNARTESMQRAIKDAIKYLELVPFTSAEDDEFLDADELYSSVHEVIGAALWMSNVSAVNSLAVKWCIPEEVDKQPYSQNQMVHAAIAKLRATTITTELLRDTFGRNFEQAFTLLTIIGDYNNPLEKLSTIDASSVFDGFETTANFARAALFADYNDRHESADLSHDELADLLNLAGDVCANACNIDVSIYKDAVRFVYASQLVGMVGFTHEMSTALIERFSTYFSSKPYFFVSAHSYIETLSDLVRNAAHTLSIQGLQNPEKQNAFDLAMLTMQAVRAMAVNPLDAEIVGYILIDSASEANETLDQEVKNLYRLNITNETMTSLFGKNWQVVVSVLRNASLLTQREVDRLAADYDSRDVNFIKEAFNKANACVQDSPDADRWSRLIKLSSFQVNSQKIEPNIDLTGVTGIDVHEALLTALLGVLTVDRVGEDGYTVEHNRALVNGVRGIF